MADKPETKAEKAEAKAAKAAPLGAAGESTDPRVHQVLAELTINELNEDKDAIAASKAALAELGVE